MPTFTINENAPILVDFKSGPGLQQTTRGITTPQEIVEKSEKAIESAMSTIRAMATRVNATIDAISDRPNKVEVEFSLKLDAEAGAVIASASTEASFNVKLTWERQSPRKPLPEMD